jgi:hypothetical protein
VGRATVRQRVEAKRGSVQKKKAMGITLPTSTLLRADELIE